MSDTLALASSSTPQANENVPQIGQPLADVRNLAVVVEQLRQGVASLGGYRGTPYDRAVTFNDLVRMGIFNPTTAVAAPGDSGSETGGDGTTIVTGDTPPLYPVDGDGWWDSLGGQLYIYYDDGVGDPQWVAATNQSGGAGSRVVTDDTPPATPVDGDAWWDSVSGQLYIYYDDGAGAPQWVAASNRPGPQGPPGPAGGGGGSGSSIVTSDVPPASPVDGDVWWDSIGGQLYIYYDDGAGAPQWVAATNRPGPPGTPGAAGPEGPQGATGATGPQGPAGAAGGGRVVTNDTPPLSPVDGDTWWDSVGGQLYIRYDDGVGPPQWVAATNNSGLPKGETGAQGPQGPQGLTGPQGPAGPQGPQGNTGLTGPQGPAGGGGSGVIISDTAPTASTGDLWWDSVGGQLYVRYADPNSTAWIIANSFSVAGGEIIMDCGPF